MALWLLYGWWEYERSDFAACYGVYGISGIFHDLPASKKPLDGSSLGGALCWGCYLLMFDVTQHIFASGLVASAFAAVYAEIFARKKMAPTLLFVIPSVVPLIPGSSLYYTMSAAVSGNTREISEYGSLTLQYALSIAAGISIVWTFCSIWRRYQTMNYIKKHSD